MFKTKQLSKIFYRFLGISALLPLLFLLTSPNTYASGKRPSTPKFDHLVKIMDIQIKYDDQNRQGTPQVTFYGQSVQRIPDPSNTNQYSVYTRIYPDASNSDALLIDSFTIKADGQPLLYVTQSQCNEGQESFLCEIESLENQMISYKIPGISYKINWNNNPNEFYPGN